MVVNDNNPENINFITCMDYSTNIYKANELSSKDYTRKQ